MKRLVSIFLGLVWVLGAHGCGDDEGRAAAGGVLDGGGRATLDAGSVGRARRDSGNNPDGAGPDTPPTLASSPSEACAAEPLTPLGTSCDAPDPSEPNTPRKPALLSIGASCNVVRAWTADKDEDGYRFQLEHADPVRVELSYVAQGQAELTALVRDGTERVLARTVSTDERPIEHQSAVFQGTAFTSYDVALEGALLGTCLPYALRVDPHWCSDAFEDNDSETSATKLSRGSEKTLHIDASASEGDMDFYELTTPKADPVRISGSYTVPDGDTLQLRRVVRNTAGLGAIDVAGARSGSSEAFVHWLVSNTPGAMFRAQIWPTGTGCGTYQLSFDVAACSDAFEDNDSASAAAALPFGMDVSGSSFRGDDDYYDLSGSTGDGLCTLTYTPAPNSGQTLSMVVYGNGSATPASSSTSSGAPATRSESVGFRGPASSLAISASAAGDCQPYVLRCEHAGVPIAR